MVFVPLTIFYDRRLTIPLGLARSAKPNVHLVRMNTVTSGCDSTLMRLMSPVQGQQLKRHHH